MYWKGKAVAASVNNPKIILADEPTGALDSKTSEEIMKIIKNISKHCLVILVTHNDLLASQYSDRIVRMLDGQIIEDKEINSIENSEVERTQTRKKSP